MNKNIKALIAANDSASFESAFKYLKSIDADDDLWISMLSVSRIRKLLSIKDPKTTNCLLEIAASSNRMTDHFKPILNDHKNKHHDQFSHLTYISPIAARAFLQEGPGIYLPGLSELDDDTAQILANSSRSLDNLDGVLRLNSNQGHLALAHKLAAQKYSLSLHYLVELTDDAAAALSKHRGNRINLSNLKTLGGSPGYVALASTIAHDHGPATYLSGLTALSISAARQLADHRHPLVLGLTELTEELASVLSKHKGGNLELRSLRSLSASAAGALAEYQGKLYLNSITELSAEAALMLAKHKGKLCLDGIETISHDAACALAESDVEIIGMRSLIYLNDSDSHTGLAAKLVKNNEYLFLLNLKSISEKIAYILIKCRGSLYLDGLHEISDGVAAALASHEGQLSLKGLRRLEDIPGHIALAQRASRGNVSFEAIAEISVGCAEALSKRSYVSLPALKSLRKGVAVALSATANLRLEGLRELSDVDAIALGMLKGENLTPAAKGGQLYRTAPDLNLAGLKELSDEGVASLVKFQPEIYLTIGLEKLSVDAAKALSKYHQGDLILSAITYLDRDVASILSKHVGSIDMPALEEAEDAVANELAQSAKLKLTGLKRLNDSPGNLALAASLVRWTENRYILPLPKLIQLSELAAIELSRLPSSQLIVPDETLDVIRKARRAPNS